MNSFTVLYAFIEALTSTDLHMLQKRSSHTALTIPAASAMVIARAAMTTNDLGGGRDGNAF